MTRREIYNLFGGKCAYCGKKLDFDDMTVDHVLPQCKGGTNDPENTYPACYLCNNQKADMTLEEFREYISNIEEELDTNKAYRLALRFNKISVKPRDIKFYFENYNKYN